ncbi:MAG: polysaccharide biosynthesis/export family protein [Planctomycetes bacterium]|nr:polysaccharide biosynthesis/export family protein [Planctomycetota bacterium]
MQSGRDTPLRKAGQWPTVVSAACVLLLSQGLMGCGADHRISLEQFLVMQQDAREAAVESPSAAELDEVRALLDRQLGPYKVGPGDELTVTLTGADATPLFPPTIARVNREGRIDLPLVGAIDVNGMELEDIDHTIRDAYVPAVLKDVAAHVSLYATEATEVLVVGAVTAPGLVPLRRTERNLLFAIVGAGGASDLATGEVTLQRLRQPGETLSLDLTNPMELRAALALEPLADGDILTVHAAAPNTIFVGGLVNAPQPQAYPPGVQISILQALAASGGLRTDVYPREGTLIRRMPNGQDVHVKLDLKRIGNGRDPNILLAGGDILWVPETLETRIQDWINRNIFFRAGVSVNYNVTGIEYLNRRSQQSRLGGGNLQDSFDPFGFLVQNAALQGLAP